MKANRILYIVILFMALVFVYYYGGRVPYTLLYTVLILPVVSFLHIAFAYFAFKYEQSIDRDAVQKGEKVACTLNLFNKGLFFIPYAKIEFYGRENTTNQKSLTKEIFISPLNKRVFKVDYVYKYRGIFETGVKSIEIRDFLGIFKFKYGYKKPLLIRVYPRIIDIEKFETNSYTPFYNSLSRSIYEDTSVIDEINKYRYGDSLSRVHWKLTAKTNEIMVKKFEGSSAQKLIFIFDLKKNSYREKSNNIIEDKLIEASICVLKYLITNDAEVRFSYYNKEIFNIECKGLKDFENLYGFFANVKFDQKINLKDIIEFQVNENLNKQDIIISTSNMDYDLYETLYNVKLSGHNIALIYVSPKEIEDEKEDVNGILNELKKLGINLYLINISSNIKDIFEHGGDKKNEKI